MHKDQCSNIKERILYFAKLKKFKLGFFFDTIGMTSANFRGKAQETPINSSTLEIIFKEFPEINLEWLLTGNGDATRTMPNQENMPGEVLELLKLQIEKLTSDKQQLISDKESLIKDKELLVSILKDTVKR